MEVTPLILDTAVVLVLLYFAVTRWRQGFATALVRLLSVVLSFLGARICAPLAADYAFTWLFREPILNNIEQALGEAAGAAMPMLEQAAQAVKELPEALVRLLGLESLNLSESLSGVVSNTSHELAVNLTDLAIAPAAVSVLQLLFFLVIFLLLSVLLGYLARSMRFVSYIPLIGPLNRLFGMAMGVLEGLVVLCLLGMLAHLFFSMGGSLPFLSEQAVQGSWLFSRFWPALSSSVTWLKS